MITVISTPTRTINGIESNCVAARSQALFMFSTDQAAQQNYKINIRILDTSDVQLIPTVFKYSVKVDGTVNIDLGRITTEINEARGNLSGSFKIGYSETYTGFVGAETIIGEWLAVYGEKPILSTGGANMYEYVLDTVIPAKLLTVFENPIYWTGFKRTLNFLMDSNFNARTGLTQTTVKSTFYDINGVPGFIEESIPDTDLTARTVFANVLQNTVGSVGVKVDLLSEEVIYKQRDVCKNPIMIDWLNSLGGVDQWVFEVDQIIERDALQGLTYQAAITGDIANVNRTKFRQSPKWIQQIICRAENLTIDQLKALEEIKSSISVRAWLTLDGAEWVGVVASGNYKTEHNSQDKFHSFTLQIELPDNFDFGKSNKYFEAKIDTLIDSDLDTLIDSDLEILIG